ncbi:MAG: NigD-like N-terminal domain-containing protein [Bacteroidales bacterium]|nr:NigD-like N-terminal domain-containing protein [Candidatus Physcousia equi]
MTHAAAHNDYPMRWTSFVRHRMMKCARSVVAGAACFLLFACSDEDQDKPYPSIITELCCLHTTSNGTFGHLQLDNGTRYTISNPQSGYHASVSYRVLCGFVPKGGEAEIYQLSAALLLHDSTAVQQHDPVSILSSWRSGRFLNFHLAPKTQGGTQYWGYVVDRIDTSCSETNAQGEPLTTAYVSLHHNQNADPTSYTTDVYASIPLDSIQADRIELSPM